MNIILHRISALFLMCMCVISLKASEITVDSLKYTLNSQDSSASVSGYIEGVKHVVIPSTINHGDTIFKVTSVADGCFGRDNDLLSVIVPGSVKIIGVYSFYKCKNLKTIVLNEGLEDLEQGCFQFSNISSIVLPASLKTIHKYCFDGCVSLKKIICLSQTPPTCMSYELKDLNPTCYVPDVYSYRTSVWGTIEHIYNSYYSKGLLFTIDKYKRTAELVANDYSGDIVVPESFISGEEEYKVTSFENGCFYSCKNLTSIKIPNTITSLEKSCFIACSALKDVTLSNSITSLSASCFWDCTALQHINIPQSVVSIDENCFRGCVSLKDITIPNSVTSLGDGCFYECRELEKITLSNALTSLGNQCFYGCLNLSQITVPDGVTSLGFECFRYCRKLDSLRLPSSLTSVGEDCFSDVGLRWLGGPCKLMVDDNFPSSLLTAYTGYYGFTNGGGCFVIPVQQLKLSTDELSIVNNRPTTKLEVKVSPSLANNKVLTITPENNSIVQIDANDSIVPIRQGETYVDYQTTDGSNLSARLHVKVSFAPTESLDLKADNVNLVIHQTYHPSITVYPSGANQRVKMISSDVEVAKVFATDSIFAVSPGDADIRLEAFDDANKFVTLHVTVYDHTDSIKVDKSQKSLYIGQVYQPSFIVSSFFLVYLHKVSTSSVE